MAYGIPPKAQSSFLLDGLTPAQYQAMAGMALKQLGWQVELYASGYIMAITPKNGKTYGEEFRIKIYTNEVKISSKTTLSKITDWGINAQNINNFREALANVLAVTTLAELDEVLERTGQNHAGLLEGEHEHYEASGLKDYFIPKGPYFFTPILMYLNFLYYFIMWFSGVNMLDPDTENLIRWGGNLKSLTLDGQCWRLLSAAFMHGGLMHIVMNMYALVFIGFLLEPILGKWRFLGCYLLAAIAGNLLSVGFHEHVVSVGASGAIFGMFGLFLVFLLPGNFFPEDINAKMFLGIGFFVLYSLYSGIRGHSNTDNAAHIGGLLCGLMLGILLLKGFRQSEEHAFRNVFSSLVFGFTGILCFTTLYFLSDAKAKYMHVYEQWRDNEYKAINQFRMYEDSSAKKFGQILADSAAPLWKQNAILWEKWHCKDSIYEHRRDLLLRYSKLQNTYYTMLSKQKLEGTDLFDTQIEELEYQISNIRYDISEVGLEDRIKD